MSKGCSIFSIGAVKYKDLDRAKPTIDKQLNHPAIVGDSLL